MKWLLPCAQRNCLTEGFLHAIFDLNDRLQVYIRPAESYSTGQLEFHCMAVYPSQQEEQLVLKQSDTLIPVALDEAELIKQEVCKLL